MRRGLETGITMITAIALDPHPEVALENVQTLEIEVGPDQSPPIAEAATLQGRLDHDLAQDN